MESAPKPHHIEASRLDRLTRLCRAAGVDQAIGLAGDLLPLNKGVLLLIGRTRDGRRMWVERAGMALDPAEGPPSVEAPAELRARIGLGVAVSRWTGTRSARSG
jgi:hypothetical protein